MNKDTEVVTITTPLNVPSVVAKEPLFSLKNFLRPTTSNMTIVGTVIKSACASLVLFAATLVMTNPILAVYLTIAAVTLGGIGEALVLFTKATPASTISDAVEDIITTKEENHE